jgi:hypothetical protein
MISSLWECLHVTHKKLGFTSTDSWLDWGSISTIEFVIAYKNECRLKSDTLSTEKDWVYLVCHVPNVTHKCQTEGFQHDLAKVTEIEGF